MWSYIGGIGYLMKTTRWTKRTVYIELSIMAGMLALMDVSHKYNQLSQFWAVKDPAYR